MQLEKSKLAGELEVTREEMQRLEARNNELKAQLE